MIFVAVLSVLGFMAFRAVFFSSPSQSFTISHALTAEEKDVLRQQILLEEQQRHQAEIAQLQAEAAAVREEIRYKLELEQQKAQQDSKVIADLQSQLANVDKDVAVKSEQARKKFTNEIDGIVSLRLAHLQKQIIDSNADEMLGWFCQADIDDFAMSTSVEEAPVDLFDQPCIGVASEGDPSVPLRRFSMDAPDVTYALAQQLLASLVNRTGSDEDIVYQRSSVASFQFNPRRPDRCCDTFLFGVHPVFGMFYKLRLPLTSEDADSPLDYDVQTMCFRRKFHPRPLIRPFTPDSSVEHLKNPSKYLPKLAEAADTARVLKDKKKPEPKDDFAPGTVHVILPFRASNLDLLPSVLKNLGRVRAYTTAPFRLIIAPVTLAADYSFSVEQRLQEVVAVAGPALGLSITVSRSLSAEEMTKATLSPLLQDWIDAKQVPELADVTAPAPAGVLPNPFLSAVIGALGLVPKDRAPVFLLDSATYSLPNDAVKKALWRIINGRMVYAPIVSTYEAVQVSNDLLGDGGITEPLPESGESPAYLTASWWQDVGGIEDMLDDRRRLRAAVPRTASRKLQQASNDDVDSYGKYADDDAVGTGSAGYYSGTEAYDDDYGEYLYEGSEEGYDRRRAVEAKTGGKRLLQAPAPSSASETSDSESSTSETSNSESSTSETSASESSESEPSAAEYSSAERRRAVRVSSGGKRALRSKTGGKRLLQSEGEGLGLEDGLGFVDDDIQFAYGYSAADILMEDFESEYEWTGLDPALLSDLEDMYGVGEGVGDEDGYHAYYLAGDDDLVLTEEESDGEDDLDFGDWDGYDVEMSIPLVSRVTALAATKSDIASMIWRVIDGKGEVYNGPPSGDDCIMRRLLTAARQDGYRIVRTESPGLLVDAGKAEAEEGEVCNCDTDNDAGDAHCTLVLAQTAVDDDIDEDRVNCVLTSLFTSEGIDTDARIKEEGVSGDIDIADIVSVSHAVRFVKPSGGVEIVAKVFAAPSPSTGRVLQAAPLNPEVFSFQWQLSSKIRLLEED